MCSYLFFALVDVLVVKIEVCVQVYCCFLPTIGYAVDL